MADTITAPINARERAGFLSLLKEIVVHKSVTASTPKAMSVDEEDDATARLLEDQTEVKHQKSTPAKINTPRVNPNAIFAGAFLETFEPDGFDLTTNIVTSINGIPDQDNPGETLKELPYEGKINVWHAIFTFLGVPSRFSTFGPATSIAEGRVNVPSMGGANHLYNFIGGWYPYKKLSDDGKTVTRDFGERNIWQIVFMVIPVKILIGIWNLVTMPVKFALNIVKLFTEFLPTVILNGTGLLLNWSTDRLKKTWDREAKGSEYAKKGLALFVLGLFTLVMGIPHYVSRIWALVGRAFTSPEKSARLAFDFGNSLKIEEHEKLTNVLRKVFAITAATLSVALTIALWAVLLPFAIAAIVKFVPQVMLAVNAVASSSLIAPAMGYVNGALQVISGFLSIFNPAVVALSTFVGVTVTPAILAVGATLAAFAGLVSTIGGRLALEFRNWWALRPSNSGPFHFFANLVTGKGKRVPDRELEDFSKPDPILAQIQELVREGKLSEARVVALDQPNPGLYLVELDPTAADINDRFGNFKPVVTTLTPPRANSNNDAKPSAAAEALVLKQLWAEGKVEDSWTHANKVGQVFVNAFFIQEDPSRADSWVAKKELLVQAMDPDNQPFEEAVAHIKL